MSSTKKVIKISISPDFKRDFKHLAKKYASLRSDLNELMQSLWETPNQGTDLGQGFRKIRLAIASKGKGKSGGARIITYTLTLTEEGIEITLLTIYDKSEKANVTRKELLAILAATGL